MKEYREAMDDQANWNELCRRAWAEEDPVKFLQTTMQIMKFLARKQQGLDAVFDESQQFQEIQAQQAQRTQRKNTVN
jgi:hypothetical protein